METTQKIYLLSWINNTNASPIGIFDSIEGINEAIKVRFDFINEALPKKDEDYKIQEFQFNIIDD